MNATTTLPFANLSMVLFHTLEPIILASITVSVLTLLTNFYAIVAVSLFGKVHSPTLVLYTCLFCNYVLLAVVTLCNRVRVLVQRHVPGSGIMDEANCFRWNACTIFAVTTVTDMYLLLALDRFLAVCAPHWYKYRYRRCLMWSELSVVVFHGVLETLLRYFTVTNRLLFICFINNFGTLYVVHSQYYRYLCTILSAVILNACLIVLMKFKLRRSTYNFRKPDVCYRRRNIRVIITLTLCIGTELFTFFVGHVLEDVALAEDDVIKKMRIGSGRLIVFSSGLLNFLVLLFRQGELRSCFLKPFMRRTSSHLTNAPGTLLREYKQRHWFRRSKTQRKQVLPCSSNVPRCTSSLVVCSSAAN